MAGQRTKVKIVRVEIVRWLLLRALDFGQPKAGLDRDNNAYGDAILEFEYLREVAFESIGPNVPACSGLDELRRNPHPLSRLAD